MNEKIKVFLEQETGYMIDNDVKNLIEAGILDSFSMFKLISFLETEFAVKLDLNKLSPKNFNSIKTISKVVQKKKK